MPLFDLPLASLETYTPTVDCPADFDTFWHTTLSETRRHDLNAVFEPVDCGLQTLDTYDVTFSGYGGQRVKGWFLIPKHPKGPLPCVVEFIGYGGGRGFATDWLLYSSMGYAHLIMDTRGQGSAWRRGDTPDVSDVGSSPQYPGFMTRGILDPPTYYYRRVFSDAVRAVEAARSNELVDSERVAVHGGSQGGGISLAVAGLVSDIQLAMPDVPFLCHFQRAVTLIDTNPYGEIINFLKTHRDLKERVYKTLSYFDGVNFAARAKAKALFSVGLMDTICPPSTVYAAYNAYAGDKDIRVWEFNNHEGGQSYQDLEKVTFLKTHLPL